MGFMFDLLYLALAVIYLPVFIFRRKFHSGFLSRLGFLPKDLALNNPIWIHAVSVGEAITIRGLREELRKAYPEKKIVISTVTATGNKIARGIVEEGDFVTYLPLDFSFVVSSVIDRINPSLFIIAETEIWPNLISTLYKNRIPTLVVNGRISDNSFRGYLMIKFLLRPILNKISLFCMQTDRDAQRLMRLGVRPDKIQVTGNMKFDVLTSLSINPERAKRVEWIDFGNFADYKADSTDYRQKLGISGREKLFVAASTHPGEEEMVLGAYKELRKELVDLNLLVAPRHPERTGEIITLIKKYGFQAQRISFLNEPTDKRVDEQAVFILDSIGQLMSYYAIADIVFVGGSLIKKGGHNILEPAFLGKPILFGPYMFNFRDIAQLFLKNQAGILVHNQEELKEKAGYLLRNPQAITKLTDSAKQIILQNQGATQRNLKLIRNLHANVPI